MEELFGTPISGTVAPDTFEPILPPEEIDLSLVEQWRLYLTDCLKNNFSLRASLAVADSGGTVLWLPQLKEQSPSALKLVQEFAGECLKDFVRTITGRSGKVSVQE